MTRMESEKFCDVHQRKRSWTVVLFWVAKIASASANNSIRMRLIMRVALFDRGVQRQDLLQAVLLNGIGDVVSFGGRRGPGPGRELECEQPVERHLAHQRQG